MRVKKFEAKTMKDALKMVKTELGPDAVILGARENKKSFGLGGDTSFEVTAAVSESTLQKKKFVESRLRGDDREKFQAADARAQKRMIEKMVERRTASNQALARSAENAANDGRPRPITTMSYIDIEDDIPQPTAQPARRPATGPSAQQVYAARTASQLTARVAAQAAAQTAVQSAAQTQAQVQRAQVQAARPQAGQGGLERVSAQPPQPVRADVRNKIKNLAAQAWEAGAVMAAPTPAQIPVAQQTQRDREINSLKTEIQRLQSLIEGFQKVPQTFQGAGHPGGEYGLSYDFSAAFQKLADAGLSKDLVAEILTRASQEIDPLNAKKRAIVEAWVAKWLLSNIAVCERPLAGRVHTFVGPMGGGKTAQMIKVASQLVIRDKKRIAIVSTDTTKVGAVDQLKIYCQILNVPFAVVRDRADWEWLAPHLANVDHVLVDTAGVSLRDMDEIQNLRALLPTGGEPQVHLCLPSSMQEDDALETVRRFRVAQPTDLIFTGVDLSVNHGVIATVQLRTGLPLHSFGTGSRVPEDFEFATKERVLDLLFKLSSLKRSTEK